MKGCGTTITLEFLSASARLIFPFGSHLHAELVEMLKKRKKERKPPFCQCSWKKVSHFFFFLKRVVSLALLRKSFSLDLIRRFQNSSPEKPQSPRLRVGWQQQPYLQCINVKSGPSCTALFDVCFPQINQLHPPLPLSTPPPY